MKRHHWITLVFALSGFISACGDDTTSSRGVPGMCDVAPVLPEAMSCDGPDDDGWSNLPPPETLPCPPPPPGDCVQAVLGRLMDTARYIGCPGYVVLNRDDWTIDLNDDFIACIDMCGVGTCDPPVLIASPQSSIPDFSEDFMQTTVTSRELCQLHNAGCQVVVEESGQGYSDCPCQ